MSAPQNEAEHTEGVALSPVQRLERSRARMRRVLAGSAQGEDGEHRAAAAEGASWRERLEGMPGLGAAFVALQAWWAQNPMRASFVVAHEIAAATLRPIARRHPFALVSIAMLIGVALAWARPWRGAVQSALFADMVPRVASRLFTSLPIEAWMEVLLSVLGRPVHPPSSSTASGSSASGTADIPPPASAAPVGTHPSSAAATHPPN